MSTVTPPNFNYLTSSQTLCCIGDWTLPQEHNIDLLFPKLRQILQAAHIKQLILDGSQLTTLDSIGIWWLERIFLVLRNQQIQYTLQGFSAKHEELVQLLAKKLADCHPIPHLPHLIGVAQLGKTVIAAGKEAFEYISFTGQICTTLAYAIRHPRVVPWRMLFNVIQTAGYNALPITGLLTFLIGVVLAYQMGLQLRNYGANVYVVDLMALSVLREFGPLMTAIIVAGRSGSAFTAQIGTMKVNQEIDALSTLGINPVQRLVLPKLLGLMIALPLLSVWADLLGIFGGMIMANSILGIKFSYFLQRFDEVVPLRWYVIGLVKTPVFAWLIASIGCFQGLQVKYNADSVGTHTTKSVVQAIFMIITFDALFSILLSWLKL